MGWRPTLVVAVLAATSFVSGVVPAAAAPTVVDDVVKDIGDTRADILTLSVDDQPRTLTVGVRLAEFTDPRTDPHWADPVGTSAMEASIDANNDGRVDYLLSFYRMAAKPKPVLTARVSNYPTATLRCEASYSLDPKGAWIRLTAPKTCMPASAPYRVRVMYAFNRSADRPIYGPLTDIVPDHGRWFPSR